KGDFELIIEEKKAVIESDNLPVIYGIPVQIRQLFSNLISNALKFTPNRQPYIQIRLSPLNAKELILHNGLDTRRDYYHLLFVDNGIGFNQNNAKQIFDIF